MTTNNTAIPDASLRKLILQDKPLHHGLVHRVVDNKPGKLKARMSKRHNNSYMPTCHNIIKSNIYASLI